MNLKGLFEGSSIALPVNGLPPLEIDAEGDVVYPESLGKEQVAEAEKALKALFPEAKVAKKSEKQS